MRSIWRRFCGGAAAGNPFINLAATILLLMLAAGCAESPVSEQAAPAAPVVVSQATIESPTDMIQDKLGNLYISEAGTGTVYCLGADGNIAILAEGLDTPGALCMDRDHNLLVAETGAGRIIRIRPDGTRKVLLGQ